MSNAFTISTARRLILKIGSALLVDQMTGLLRRVWLGGLIEDIVNIRRRGQDIAVVTSGAVALGRHYLGLSPQRRRLKLREKQAAAAMGQISLMRAYQESLAACGIPTAQVLLTLEDLENRNRYLNARNTFETLFRFGVVPVINENDTVATQEIRFGDNDRLAARVAEMISAKILVLFSDIDGLYTTNPRIDPAAVFVPEVHDITPTIKAMADVSSSTYGSGGMITKLMAAQICMNAGCCMIIAAGRYLRPLHALETGKQCTWFIPSVSCYPARKRWIAGALRTTGTLIIDDGAVTALREGSSLLPAGVIASDGQFSAGETVLVCDRFGHTIARGLVTYSARETNKIIGKHTRNIPKILGHFSRDELIHRDDLVLEKRLKEH